MGLRRTRVGPGAQQQHVRYLPPISTSWDGYYYYPNYSGIFLKSIGADKPAGFAYGISPSSQASIKVIYEGASQSGVLGLLRQLLGTLRRGRLHR